MRLMKKFVPVMTSLCVFEKAALLICFIFAGVIQALVFPRNVKL